jgi:hypothetical protein
MSHDQFRDSRGDSSKEAGLFFVHRGLLSLPGEGRQKWSGRDVVLRKDEARKEPTVVPIAGKKVGLQRQRINKSGLDTHVRPV